MTETEVREFIIEHLEHEVKWREIEMAVAKKDGIVREYEFEYLEIMHEFIEFTKSVGDAQKAYAHMCHVVNEAKDKRKPYENRGFMALTKEERDEKNEVFGLVIALHGSLTAIDYAMRLIEPNE